MTAAAATTASARAGAVGGARGAGDIDALAGRLAKSNQDPDKLTEAMTGMGYSQSEARAAAQRATGTTPKPKAAAKKATPAAAKAPADDGEQSFTKQGKPVGFTDTPSAPAFRMPSPGGSGSGLLLALVLYPAGLAFLRGGPTGLKKWFMAKFFNKVGATGTPA